MTQIFTDCTDWGGAQKPVCGICGNLGNPTQLVSLPSTIVVADFP